MDYCHRSVVKGPNVMHTEYGDFTAASIFFIDAVSNVADGLYELLHLLHVYDIMTAPLRCQKFLQRILTVSEHRRRP